jgi:hypothetical protein
MMGMFFIPNQSLGFGLYYCFILSGFSLDFSQAQWTMSKKYDKKTPIETKRQAENINAQN